MFKTTYFNKTKHSDLFVLILRMFDWLHPLALVEPYTTSIPFTLASFTTDRRRSTAWPERSGGHTPVILRTEHSWTEQSLRIYWSATILSVGRRGGRDQEHDCNSIDGFLLHDGLSRMQIQKLLD